MLQLYERDDITLASDSDASGAEVSKVRETLRTFIRGNYSHFTLEQLCTMLGTSPGFIVECLTPSQLKRLGYKPIQSVLIVRDMKDLEGDLQELNSEPISAEVLPKEAYSYNRVDRIPVISILPDGDESLTVEEVEEVMSDAGLWSMNDSLGIIEEGSINITASSISKKTLLTTEGFIREDYPQ